MAWINEIWTFTRGLTNDLLGALDDEALGYSPGSGLGPSWKQFRHVGRVQENYVEALETRRIVFDVTDTYRGGPSRDGLAGYLRSVDERMEMILGSIDPNAEIDWDGDTIPLDVHLH